MEKTLLVGLWAGPGAGKSTGAAYVFSKLKMAGINCELAQEYAKDRVWQEDFKVFENQFYVTAKQSLRVSRLYGKVDVIVTDAPVLQGAPYAVNKPYYEDYRRCLRAIYDEIPHLDFFIHRNKSYNPKGRFQDEAGARVLDEEILSFMKTEGLEFTEVFGDLEGYDTIVEKTLNVLGG